LSEKQILYITDKKAVVRRQYIKILRICKEELEVDGPNYLERS